MRFHVLGLPHTQTIPGAPYNSCAFTQKVVKWCQMMDGRGHDITLYGGTQNEAPCKEFVTCITDEEQAEWFQPPYPEAVPPFLLTEPGFAIFNKVAQYEIQDRIEEGDFILTVGGLAQAPVIEWVKGGIGVEFGVGYPGIFAEYKVFESYAWMHSVYGMYEGRTETGNGAPDGNMYDTVIPNYWDPSDFTVGQGDGGYLLYMARTVARKGITIAANAAKRAGKELIIAGGNGDIETKYGEYVGIVGPEERRKLLAGAEALFSPSIYVEPFGGIHIEAMMSGTPVIATDYGVYSETMRQGVDGWRCRDLGEFVWAAEHAGELDRKAIARRARKTWSLEAIAPQYESYFERVAEMETNGFYTKRTRRPGR